MPRPIGAGVTSVCSAVEKLGYASRREVHAQTPHLILSDVRTYCRRAVLLGLLDVDREVIPHLHSVVPGWREKVENSKKRVVVQRADTDPAVARAAAADKTVQRAVKFQSNSIFNMR